MAITDTVVLNGSALGTTSFDLVERVGKKSTRLARTSTLAVPVELNISHQATEGKSITVDRHLVQLKHSFIDAASGSLDQVVLNLTLQVPRRADGEVIARTSMNYLLDFLSDGTLTGWTNQNNVNDVLRNGS